MLETLLIKFVNYLDTLPPLVILLFSWHNKGLRGSFIFHYLVVQLAFNLGSNIINEFRGNNLYLYHLNCLFSFFALSLFYNKLFNNKRIKIAIWIVAIFFSLSFVLSLQWESVLVFNSNTSGLLSFIFCGYSLYYFLTLYKKPTKENISRSRNFWFNTGIFSYYTINFFIFLTYNKLTQDKPPLLMIVWQLHNIIFLIMCIYFFIGILCKQSPEK